MQDASFTQILGLQRCKYDKTHFTHTHLGYMTLHQPDKFIAIYFPPQICAYFIHIKYIHVMENHTISQMLKYSL